MKRFTRITFVLLLGLVIALGSFSSQPVQAEAATKTTTSKTSTVSSSKKATSKKLTTKITNWKLKKISGLRGIVEADILNGFETLGFTVTVDKAEAKKYGYTGCFSPSRQKIILRKGDTETLLHELGHFVDFVTNYQSSSKAFTKIYKAEKKNAKSFFNTPSHTLSSAKEFFAESFNEYYSNPAKLKSKCPKTYAYMAKAVKSVTPEQVASIQAYYGLY